MEINDCEIETNEIIHQDTNSGNEDDHRKQLEDFIRVSNKYSQLSDGDFRIT